MLRTWAAKFSVDEGILFSVLTLMKSKGNKIKLQYFFPSLLFFIYVKENICLIKYICV